VIHADEVQHAVDDRLRQVGGVLGADDDVAKLARPGGGFVLVNGEREHIGRLVLAAMLAVELGDPLRVDELDRDVTAVHAPRRRRQLGGAEQRRVLGPDQLHFQAQARRRRSAARSSGVACWAWSS
jgi:hypothetical protein